MTGLAGFELMEARKALHAALSALELPANGHLGAPVTREMLHEFFDEANPLPANPVTSESGHRESEPVDPNDTLAMLNAIIANRKYTATYDPAKMAALEWQAKVVPPVRPHMTNQSENTAVPMMPVIVAESNSESATTLIQKVTVHFQVGAARLPSVPRGPAVTAGTARSDDPPRVPRAKASDLTR